MSTERMLKKYQAKCPCCGETTYITCRAGNVNDGCFLETMSFCPHCGKENHVHICGHRNTKSEEINHKRIMAIANGMRKRQEDKRQSNYISISDAFNHENQNDKDKD